MEGKIDDTTRVRICETIQEIDSVPPEPPRSKIGNFIRGLYQKLLIRVIYLVCVMILSLANLTLSWLVFADAMQQQPGLVYDRTSTAVLVALLIFNFTELIFFAVELLLWINVFWNEVDAWFCVDFGNALNIFLSEIPLGLINAYLSACHESTISKSILIKSSMILIYLVLRFVTFTTVYLLESTEDGCVTTDRFNYPTGLDALGISSISLKESCKIAKLRARFFDAIRRKKLRRFWLILRIFIISGFFVMLVTNILIFNFTFVQTYRGRLEWRRIANPVGDTLQDTMAERYFHDVEIFLKETELSTRKWLHLVSLEKIMQLQNIGATEQIGLSYVRHSNKVYCLFSQLVIHKNRTTETSMTCWNVLGLDDFREVACEEIVGDGIASNNLVKLKSLRVQFTYIPPSAQRHLGIVFYNATRTTRNGTTFTNVPLRMEYFRNTIAHTLSLMKAGRVSDDDAAHNHDGWTSGPFRPSDVYTSDSQYGKYDLDAGDLVPVSEIWKTGFAMCQSTAPKGPQRWFGKT